MPEPALIRNLLAGLGAALMAATSAPGADKITYEEHVLPVLRNSCLRCHNPDKAKADLDLSAYGALLKGSGNGAVVKGGDAEGSKLLKAILHLEEPTMPPNGKLPDKEADLIRKWIEGGLLENSGSKAVTSAKPKVDLTTTAVAAKPDGPPPMPGDLLLEPVTHTERTSASTALVASPWAPLVALGSQRQVLLYNTDTLDLAGVLPFPEGSPCDLKFSRNGRLLVCGGGRGSKSGSVVIWDVTTGERILSAGEEFDAVLAADISSDQQWIALGGPDRIVKIYATKDGRLRQRMKKHTDWVTAVEFSPDSRLLATGDRGGGLVVWEATSGDELYALNGHKAAITSVDWRNPETLLSASEDGTVKIWGMEEGQQVKSWNAHGPGVLALRSTADGRVATCGRDQQVIVWKADGTRIRNLPFTNDIPVRVALAHNGDRVIASDWLGNVWVWNTTNGVKVGELSLNPPPLARQLELATNRLEEVQRLANANPATNTAALVTAANWHLQRLRLASVFTTVYQARENLARLKAEHERQIAEAATAEAAARKAGEELSARRKSVPANSDERSKLARRRQELDQVRKAQTAKLASARKAVDRLTRQLEEEKARVEKLSQRYQQQKAALTSPPGPA